MIREMGFVVGNILGIIIVVWAWMGVNLLSVGLHSYGFTAGVAIKLVVYIILQLAFVIVTYLWATKKRNAL
jgi:hypothetical protein